MPGVVRDDPAVAGEVDIGFIGHLSHPLAIAPGTEGGAGADAEMTAEAKARLDHRAGGPDPAAHAELREEWGGQQGEQQAGSGAVHGLSPGLDVERRRVVAPPSHCEPRRGEGMVRLAGICIRPPLRY